MSLISWILAATHGRKRREAPRFGPTLADLRAAGGFDELFQVEESKVDSIRQEVMEIYARIAYTRLMYRLKMRSIREKQGK